MGPTCCEHTAPVTCLFENLLVRGDDRAEAVEDQGAQLQSILLRALVVIQGVVGEHKPPLLQLQRRHLWAVLDFFVQPPWRARGECKSRTRKRNAKYQVIISTMLTNDLLEMKVIISVLSLASK